MRKTLISILAFFMIFAILLCGVPIGAIAKTTNVAVVWADNQKESEGKKFTDVEKAWNEALELGNIKMLSDWTLDDVLNVDRYKDVTLYMDGKLINRNNSSDKLYASDSGGDGSVFIVKYYAKLKIVGGKTTTEHNGYVKNKLWFYGDTKDEKTKLTLNGAVITGGATDSDYGGAVTLDENAVLDVDSVTFAGNISDEYGSSNGNGGAIKVKASFAKLYMVNSRVCYNFAEGNGGGVISEGDKTEINLINSKIDHNVADNGGGVYFEDESSKLIMDEKSSIEQNNANNGGGVYIDEESISVFGGKITKNTAKYGGGIYIRDDFSKISYCKITENVAENNGGGMYLDVYGDKLNFGNDCSFTSMEVSSNKANDSGGGIYIESAWEDISLSQTIIIEKNTAKEPYTNNMYFHDAFSNDASIVKAPGRGSRIHISVNLEDNDSWCLSSKGAFNDSYYYADGKDFHVAYDYNKCKLYYKKGSAPQKAEIINISTTDFEAKDTNDLKYKVNDEEWPVYRGFFSLVQSGEDSYDDTAVFYYSDGYFFNDPKNYDTHLATLSMNAVTASGSSKVGGNIDYTNKFTDIRQFLHNMGCDDSKTRINDEYMKKMSTDSIGVIISQKKLAASNGTDSGRLLIPVVVRSSAYESEWAGNFNLGTSGEHKGFSIAADTVMNELDGYIEEMKLTELVKNGKACFWVIGFSRGGATANLVSKRLTERYYGTDNKVFGYTFAAPQGGVQSAQKLKDDDYFNIHNTVNPSDFVPYVAPVEMGFKRYGVDHYVPGSDLGAAKVKEWHYTPKTDNYFNKSDAVYYADNEGYAAKRNSDGTLTKNNLLTYGARRDLMLKQFVATAGGNGFSDYFHIGTIDIYTFFDVLEETGDADVSVDEWLQDFLHYLQVWGTKGAKDTRTFVAEHEIDFGMSVGDAVADIMQLMKHSKNNPLTSVLGNAKDQNFFEWVGFGADAVVELFINLFDDDIKGKFNMTFDAVWTALEDSDILDGLSVNEIIRFEKDVKVILSFLVDFIVADYDNKESDYRDGLVNSYNSKAEITGKISDWFIMTGTLIQNKSFLENHSTRTYMAWVRSYDSYYNDYEIAKYGNGSTYAPRYVSLPDTKVIAPTIVGVNDGAEYDENTSFSFEMDDSLKGGSIYYTILCKSGGETKLIGEDTMLYTEPVELTALNGEVSTYIITYYSMYFGVKSEIKKVTVKVGKPSLIGSMVSGGANSIVVILMFVVAAAAVIFYFWKIGKIGNKNKKE